MNLCKLVILAVGLIVGSALIVTENVAQLAIIEPTLLVSTLDGGLYAIGKRSGLIKWTIQDEPIVKLPQLPNVTENMKQPLFLPDPKDGSLYVYNGIGGKLKGEGDHGDNGNGDDSAEKDALQKLPFTISELVSASPCKSTDGLLYTGRKVDSWITIDGKTGVKMDVLNSDSPMCPKTDEDDESLKNKDDQILLGKSEYHLSIFDLNTRKKQWNITLIDYSASASLAIPQSAYDVLHLTSSTTGKIVTIDLNENGERHQLLWSLQLNSPIVAMYQYNEGQAGLMRRIPFTTIGDPLNRPFTESLDTLFPSLYIGESETTKTAYAISSFVDLKDTKVLSARQRLSSLPLIEGPVNAINEGHSTKDQYFRFIVFGHYEFPAFSSAEYSSQLTLNQLQQNLLAGKDKIDLPKIIAVNNQSKRDQDDNLDEVTHNLLPLFAIALMTVASSLAFALWFRFRSRRTMVNKNLVVVGKIAFDSKAIIGRGSAGTCVYKGKFEGRQSVAVKRVIADYLVLAEREIELLRSLQHPNLIRYFATESDNLFKYIAIELAEMSLADYVEKKFYKNDSFGLTETEILYDSCKGLAHLHSIHVIHRDIKPQNILISNPLPPTGKRKVLISDFGVSKALFTESSVTSEFISTTRVIKGTEGWIAPEVLKSKLDSVGDFKAQKPIDIFSMGCLFFYIFTEGKHPFGDSLERQSNILHNQYDLQLLTSEEENIGKSCLIESMIASSPGDRPAVDTVLLHPVFWDNSKQLQFFQDLSDRIEREPHDSDIVSNLERGGFDVVKGDWRRFLSVELQSDLRKFRAYRGSSVRDLLRALRNKRHHYRELPEDVQSSLGDIPDGFVEYFTSRFPRLLYHSYIAMQAYKFEPMFKCYYDQDGSWEFSFPALPKTGIRWFELNKSPGKRSTNAGDIDQSGDSLSLKPNGFSDMNWRKGATPSLDRSSNGSFNFTVSNSSRSSSPLKKF
ncbi:Serine/threonine-protein kinase/endoribonuclease ire-1 [Halotydeus destructor]|nr:Serine/threonine-protein kinase/endoribonuclease ire-1 [Halotydeus destructor]